MAITKTDFINYTRCPRYVKLEDIRKDKLSSNLTIEEYMKLEEDNKKLEIASSMFEEIDEEEIDITDKLDIQLEAMMDYYKKVELLAAREVERLFGGTSIYSLDTYRQESFDFLDNGIRYLCYVDVYNEKEDEINIIEVKATTSKKYLDMTYKYDKRKKMGDEEYSLFEKKNNIYYISECKNHDLIDKYEKLYKKLKNRFDKCGKYIYDLAVQRYIIENDFKKHNEKRKVNYYLAVLNYEYTYDGKSDYETDSNGNSIITFFDFTDLTKEMLKLVENDKNNLEKYILSEELPDVKYGKYCGLKERTECKYKTICYKDVPEKNACYNYIDFRSFNVDGVSYNKYDLLNIGYRRLDDVPYEWLTSKNHIIERDSYDDNKEYVNKEKIKLGLRELSYPIYHLDFETFPCPLPRFKGERPYIQSPFEFSLHIEREPGECDKDKDNYVFLADSLNDEREELVKELVNRIDLSNGGCMLAQNVAFEKGRIEELWGIFPKYKKELKKIYDSAFDLLWLVKGKKEMYKDLGLSKEECGIVNYYHPDLSGSYSIKKTLPVFSDLSYKDLEIGNGTEALVEYSKYNLKSPEELKRTKNNLIVYCKQDTWAMVEILKALREKVK